MVAKIRKKLRKKNVRYLLFSEVTRSSWTSSFAGRVKTIRRDVQVQISIYDLKQEKVVLRGLFDGNDIYRREDSYDRYYPSTTDGLAFFFATLH